MTARPGRVARGPARTGLAPALPGQREILDAAALAFTQNGFAATSMDEIAERLGATKGRLYHYYAAKADIFRDIVRAGLAFRLARSKTGVVLGSLVDRVQDTVGLLAVVGIGVATPRGEIVSALRRFHVSAVPVIDGALRPIGVVSEADMVAAPADDQAPASNRRRRDRAVAADLMTAPAVTISASAPLMEAARLMGERHVRRLVAVHSDGRVAGIVSRHDLLDL